MGFYKERQIRETEQGWAFIGRKCVCAACFADYALQSYVKDNASSRHCDYCGAHSDSPIAMPIDDVMAFINDGIRMEWEDLINELPYDSREGGYLGEVITADELFMDVLMPFNNDELAEDVINAYNTISGRFCQKDYFGPREDQVLVWGWQSFCRTVMHEARYLFHINEHPEDAFGELIPPSRFLNRLGDIVTECNLVRELSADTVIFRCRIHNASKWLTSAQDLGPPPEEASVSNRMSPAGIPLFYGAFDEMTALRETLDPSKSDQNKVATVAVFKLARPIVVCDFTHLPPMPSLFDKAQRHRRPSLNFLRSFVCDVAKPIVKDGRVHVDYVPTQIVTEYFRRIYQHPVYGRVQGILYPSARCPGGTCCVLFFTRQDCTEIREGWESVRDNDRYKWWLGLDTSSLQRRTLPSLRTSNDKDIALDDFCLDGRFIPD